jgi:hypothetical protein
MSVDICDKSCPLCCFQEEGNQLMFVDKYKINGIINNNIRLNEKIKILESSLHEQGILVNVLVKRLNKSEKDNSILSENNKVLFSRVESLEERLLKLELKTKQEEYR